MLSVVTLLSNTGPIFPQHPKTLLERCFLLALVSYLYITNASVVISPAEVPYINKMLTSR